MMTTSASYPLDNLQFSTTCLDKPKRSPWETDEQYEERLPKMIEIPKPKPDKKSWQSKWPA